MPLRSEYEHTAVRECEAGKGLGRPETVDYRGFVFVRLAPEGLGFEEYAGDMLAVLDNLVDRFPEGELTVMGGCLRSLIHCNWKMYLESVNDAIHAISTHQSVTSATTTVWNAEPDQSSMPMAVEQLLPFGSSLDFVRTMGARVLDNGHSILGTQASAFWRTGQEQDLGKKGVALIEDILCGSVEVRALLRAELAYAEAELIRLIERQARVLRIIGGRKRAVIAGGAGTGKTLIAIEKARQLAAQHQTVLLLCYNRPLADVLAHGLANVERLTVMSYHQLCERRVALVREHIGRDLLVEPAESYPGQGERHKFEILMPFALALANDILADDLFDSVIVDEAQDFSDEYWFGVETLLKDPAEGAFYLFTDRNQAIYRRDAKLPIEDEPFFLTANCRNTTPIRTLAYGFYVGEPVDHPELGGPDVDIVRLETDAQQAAEIERRVRHLLLDEKVAPADIVVLLAKRPKGALYELLGQHQLPGKTD